MFTVGGAAEASKFYLPLTIFTIALFIVNAINRVGHPLIAGMKTEEERINFVTYSIKIGYIFTMPVVVPLLYFANDFLGLIGNDFASAGSTLVILVVAIPLSIISEIVYYFVYGSGNKKAVLYLGLAGNIPRIILYFVLVPMFGADGAALAYVVGSVVQLVLSLKIAKNYSLAMQFKNYVLLSLVPLTIGGVMWLFNLQFVISTILILCGSFILYIKLHLLTDLELHNIIYAGFPTATAKKLYPTLSRIMHKIS